MAVCCTPISASLIRHVWEVIEQTQSYALLISNDQEIVRHLVSQLQHQRSLNHQETQDVIQYLSHRTSLIRDIVSDRCGVVYC